MQNIGKTAASALTPDICTSKMRGSLNTLDTGSRQ
jgi:hypothetical protein